MPIDREKTKGELGDETLFVLNQGDEPRRYSHAEVCDLIEEADRRGYPIEAGSWLDGLTVGQLDRLLHGKPE